MRYSLLLLPVAAMALAGCVAPQPTRQVTTTSYSTPAYVSPAYAAPGTTTTTYSNPSTGTTTTYSNSAPGPYVAPGETVTTVRKSY